MLLSHSVGSWDCHLDLFLKSAMPVSIAAAVVQRAVVEAVCAGRCLQMMSGHCLCTVPGIVSQVLQPQLAAVKATVSALKSGLSALKAGSGSSTGAKARKAKPPKPGYLELLVNLQQLVFCLEQHPLETWMGLHGPLLQSIAAERHLTEQLLASCASAHGRISRSAGGTVRTDGVVAGRGGGRQAQRFGSGCKQPKQWGQARRWGTLGKKGGAAVLAGIAAGSVTEAAGAAAAEAVAAAGSLMTGAGAHAAAAHPAAHHATAAESAAGAPSDTAGPSTPAAGDAAGAGPSARSSSDAAAADVSDTEVPPGDVSADDSTDDSDTSDEEGPITHHLGPVELGDAETLAAALPASAHELAAEGEQGSDPGLGQAAGAAGAALVGAAAAGVRAAEAVPAPTDPAAAAAVLSAAAATGEAANGNTEMAQAVLQAHRELFEMYKYRCRPLAAAADDEYHHSRAVMHVSCCKAEAVVLICLPGNAAADAMATEVGLECITCRISGTAMFGLVVAVMCGLPMLTGSQTGSSDGLCKCCSSTFSAPSGELERHASLCRCR